MIFKNPLIPGKLIKRYKRFLADVELESGEIITAHCPNSGSMKTCQTPGWRVLLSYHDVPTRKYKYTWEMVHNGACWIGINTGIPNQIVADAISENKIDSLLGYPEIKREVKYGKNSRIDIYLQNDREICYTEVKNVTLVEKDNYYYFPDSVTERGRKHLYELLEMVKRGHRAVMFYVIQRSDGTIFKPASHIDPAYAESLKEVHNKGVEILVYQAEVTPESIDIKDEIPWVLE
jgi:sugar fermentation stimulation protein A